MKKVNGGCHCGQVTFEAEVDEQKVVLCHCTDCQQMSGAPYRGIVISSGAAFNVQGTVKNYVKDTANSGNPRIQAFCPECGTHLYATSLNGEHKDKLFNIRLGTLEQRNDLAPTVEIWCNSAQSWLPAMDGTKKIPGQPG